MLMEIHLMFFAHEVLGSHLKLIWVHHEWLIIYVRSVTWALIWSYLPGSIVDRSAFKACSSDAK